MSQPDYRDESPEDKPLDPAAQRVQAKLKRLLLGSSLIMFAGLIAVFAAIFYKINSNEGGSSGAVFVESVNVGANAEVLQASISEGMMLVLVREGTTTALLRFDPANGKLLGRTVFVGR
jgi:hypothetical protein